MVLRAIGRIIVVPLSMVVAGGAALFVLVTLGQERLVHAMTGRGPPDEATIGAAFDLLRLAAAFFSLSTLLPIVLLVIGGEVARVRSSAYYIVGSGLAFAAVPLLARLGQSGSALESAPVIWQVFATAGFVGGFVYWLLAGRNA
jgi:hypothetical protein